MIRLQHKLPKDFYLGISGGVDSIAAFDFLSRKHNIHLIYVDHGDIASETEIPFVQNIADKYNVKIDIYNRKIDIPKGASKEHFWSKQRREVFNQLNKPVILCHHLNDVVETWIVSCMQGNPKIIPYESGNVIRPFRLNEKNEFIYWANKNGIDWVEDKTNHDPNFNQRNYVRNVMIENALKVNPGLFKTVKKMVENE
jgi:tRNA(Ile)-lysidine synthase TilS/MesJ